MPDDARTRILNLADAPLHPVAHGEWFACSMAQLAAPLGARAIGANVTRVPPGKAAFPLHHHRANEEHFFVLSGHGVVRLGERVYPVGPHDYLVHPAGGPEYAHQLVNTGTEDLVYLAISTLELPDIVGYPDSGKTGVRTGAGQEPGARFIVHDEAKDRAGYWDGEDGGRVQEILRGGHVPPAGAGD
jgi:uncharacterized cupin superfamily protein